MGYLSCRAESSISTCRSISAVAPSSSSSQSHHNKRRTKQKVEGDEKDGEGSVDRPRPRRKIECFTYAELEAATGKFADSSLLGRGSHGSVYRATLARSVVAVKRPSPRQPYSPPSARNEVENEIHILSQIHDPRLVNLVGFTPSSGNSCSKSQPRLLVVEFMPNGTLYELLHSKPRLPSWPRRLRLALQTAKALLALHSARPPIIHRDVKSANILLDRNSNARLGDFGLALRLDASSPSSCHSTPPAGTLGYLDPSYVTPENLSTKTDVFSFGILLLEIMSGRKAIDVAHSPPSVVEWAIPLLRKGKVGAIYDPRMSPPKDSKLRRQLALLAASCVRSNDEKRPSMAEVVEQLKVLSKSVNAAAKAWNGLPCAAVETEGTLLKANMNVVNASKNSRLVANVGFVEETWKKGEEDEGMLVDETKQLPPLPVSAAASSALRTVHQLKNGATAVFLDAELKRESRNLMEFLARPDGEIVGKTSVISKAKTLRVTSEYYVHGGTVRLQRNHTVKGERFESSLTLERLPSLKGGFDGRARQVT